MSRSLAVWMNRGIESLVCTLDLEGYIGPDTIDEATLAEKIRGIGLFMCVNILLPYHEIKEADYDMEIRRLCASFYKGTLYLLLAMYIYKVKVGGVMYVYLESSCLVLPSRALG